MAVACVSARRLLLLSLDTQAFLSPEVQLGFIECCGKTDAFSRTDIPAGLWKAFAGGLYGFLGFAPTALEL